MRPSRTDVQARQERVLISLLSAAYDTLKQIEDHGLYDHHIQEATEIVRKQLVERLTEQATEEGLR